jgi:hypothetical protein
VCGAHLFVLSIDAQAGLELAVMVVVMAAAVAAFKSASKFSQCNVVWENYPQVKGSGF